MILMKQILKKEPKISKNKRFAKIKEQENKQTKRSLMENLLKKIITNRM